MGKYYNGKLKSIEETKIILAFNVRDTDIVMCPSPQLHLSSLVLQNSTQRCSSDSPSCRAEDFQSW